VCVMPTYILKNVSGMLGLLHVSVWCACLDWPMKSMDMSAIVNYFVRCVRSAPVHAGLFFFGDVCECCEFRSQCDETISFHDVCACLVSGIFAISVLYSFYNE
jgi:hypothetical protein